MEVRDREEGTSEGPAVMAGIGVEPLATSPRHESGQTSLWSLGTREPGEPIQEASR